MTQFSYTQVIAADTEEPRVDQIGLTILRQQARKQGLQIVSETITRTGDHLVYYVPSTGPNGEATTILAPAEMAAGTDLGDPAGRQVTWEVDANPIDSTPGVRLAATQASEAVARLALPPEVAAAGGLITVDHNLGGEVTVKAFAADLSAVASPVAFTITADSVEIRLVPGLAASIEIVLDEIPTDTEETP